MTRFRYFVIFAEMRTGSNFLEANLNAFEGLHSFGEAFNPSFVGYPNYEDLLGMTLEEREADPLELLNRIKAQEDFLGGFRYFSDHDHRIFEHVISDPDCAKIVLTRNPLDSYVSWKIAQSTGQWKLTNIKRRKDARITFDFDEFSTYLERQQQQQSLISHALQITGESAYQISYEDLNDIDVLNGLATYLGVDEQLERLDDKLKPQNPSSLEEKVENYEDMRAALNEIDTFVLSRTPNLEPRRGPAVPSMVACAEAPLLFMPIPGGPTDQILDWMAALDDVEPDELISGLGQFKLRNWMGERPGHRKFTVLRHPLARAHEVFCQKILSVGEDNLPRIRRQLRNFYKVPLPGNPEKDYALSDHRAAFVGFMEFLKSNLSMQTGIRVDAHWATQSAVLQGMAQFVLPDFILREDRLNTEIPSLLDAIEHPVAALPQINSASSIYTLDDIYDDEIEALARNVYRIDYTAFGFSDWK